MRQHRAARELVQDFGPGRTHAHPLAGGKHDGQTAAGVGAHDRSALSSMGVGERSLGRSESPQARSGRATIAAGERGFQPRRGLYQRDLPVATKSVSLRRKKRYTTARPRTERDGLAPRFSHLYWLIFHFWLGATLCAGPFMRGSVPAGK